MTAFVAILTELDRVFSLIIVYIKTAVVQITLSWVRRALMTEGRGKGGGEES